MQANGILDTLQYPGGMLPAKDIHKINIKLSKAALYSVGWPLNSTDQLNCNSCKTVNAGGSTPFIVALYRRGLCSTVGRCNWLKMKQDFLYLFYPGGMFVGVVPIVTKHKYFVLCRWRRGPGQMQ